MKSFSYLHLVFQYWLLRVIFLWKNEKTLYYKIQAILMKHTTLSLNIKININSPRKMQLFRGCLWDSWFETLWFCPEKCNGSNLEVLKGPFKHSWIVKQISCIYISWRYCSTVGLQIWSFKVFEISSFFTLFVFNFTSHLAVQCTK